MTGDRISVVVRSDGEIQAIRSRDNSRSPVGRVAYGGLDADTIRVFERWLTQERTWRADEIEVLGALLHRSLFPPRVWSAVETMIDEAAATAAGRPGTVPVRLELVFPSDLPYSRLAAIPWEFLYRRPDGGTGGFFLAADPRVVLCRHIPLDAGEPLLPPIGRPRVLVVVSQPSDPLLGEVEYADVLEAVEGWAADHDFDVTVCRDPDAAGLRDALADGEPHVVHYMGHGRFDPARGEGALALTDPEGGTDWVPDRSLRDLVGRRGAVPRLVVLHCCEGGTADYEASFAGVAPRLAQAGVAAVVAMQYPVLNETATAFSLALYERLAAGHAVDAAVQTARWEISGLRADRDPRLVGVPVLYLQNHTEPVRLRPAGGDGP